MKSNRMFGLLCILLEKEKITAKELADYFEVSVRTIHRDLLDLSSAGFPVTTQQGIGGGVSLLPNFRYTKSALTKDDMDMILAGIKGMASIDDSAKIKTLLAKLRFNHDDKMLLENDIIIDFTSWNKGSSIMKKIRLIRTAIAQHQLLEMDYYSGNGHSQRCVEPYKLIFKEQHWYLFGYCTYKEEFRLFKVNRITDLSLKEHIFLERKDYQIPPLQSDFVNKIGEQITARIDKSLEFLAVDFFGIKSIQQKDKDSITVSFYTSNVDWTIGVFSEFGDKAEILSPEYVRNKMKKHLEKTLEKYKT